MATTLTTTLTLKDQLSGGLAQAQTALRNFGATAIQNLGRDVETAVMKGKSALGNFGDTAKQAALGMVAGFAGMKGIDLIVEQFKKMVGGAMEMEMQLNKLATALDNVGASTEEWMPKLEATSTKLLENLSIEDEVSRGIMIMALNMGVAVDQVSNVTMAAIGMSKAFGVDTNTALRATIAVMNGSAQSAARLLPQLKGMKDANQILAVMTDGANKGLMQQGQALETASGKWEKLGVTWGEVGKSLSVWLLPIIKVVSDVLASLTIMVEGLTMNLSIGLSYALYGVAKAFNFLGVVSKSTLDDMYANMEDMAAKAQDSSQRFWRVWGQTPKDVPKVSELQMSETAKQKAAAADRADMQKRVLSDQIAQEEAAYQAEQDAVDRSRATESDLEKIEQEKARRQDTANRIQAEIDDQAIAEKERETDAISEANEKKRKAEEKAISEEEELARRRRKGIEDPLNAWRRMQESALGVGDKSPEEKALQARRDAIQQEREAERDAKELASKQDQDRREQLRLKKMTQEEEARQQEYDAKKVKEAAKAQIDGIMDRKKNHIEALKRERSALAEAAKGLRESAGEDGEMEPGAAGASAIGSVATGPGIRMTPPPPSAPGATASDPMNIVLAKSAQSADTLDKIYQLLDGMRRQLPLVGAYGA